MKKRDIPISSTPHRFLPDNFWTPPAAGVIQADADEFARRFGLKPELAEVLGVRRFLREDTLKTVN